MKKFVVLSVLTTGAASTLAASVTLTGPIVAGGTGFGSVLNVLALQGNGSEAGSVGWDGFADVVTGDATSFSQTRSVGEILASGANVSDFGIVFNIAQPGNNPDVTLNQFTVVFYSENGSELFTASFNTPTVITQIGSGVGGAGYLFDITFDPFEANFFANTTNRIGIRVTDPITGSAGAPENFYLVPAPSACMLAGAAGLMSVVRRRRQAGI